MKKYQGNMRKIRRSPVLREIWQWSKASHGAIVCICVLNALVTCGSLAIAASTKGLIDSATAGDGGQLLFYAVVMSGAVLTIRGCGLASGLLSVKANGELLRTLRTMVLEHIFRKQYANLNEYHSGELVNRMFSDVSIVKNGIMDVVPGMVSMTVGFVGAVLILVRIDWRLVLLLTVGGLLGLFLIVTFRKPMTSRHKAVQESEGRLHSFLQELLENLRLIKAAGAEERVERQADVRQQEFLEAQFRKGYFSAHMHNGIYLVFQMSWLFCMLWGCYGIYCGRLTYGMLAAVLQLVGQIQGPISKASEVVGQIYGTISSAERLQELLDLPEEENSELGDGGALYQKLKEIQMCAVDFSYGRGTQFALKQVNLSIRPGEFVAVTGVSGSGKSTLFQLLLGIYQPSGGTLKFCFTNGETMEPSRSTRGLFAYVPQGNTLFSGTLRENMLLFTKEATDEEIMKAAEIACIDCFIQKLEDGLDTVIGERGLGLSEGQAQRIAVARALLSHAPILLLDECTSALDEETEEKLLKNLAALKGKTCLIVTHRRAALQICESRIHIENGKAEKREVNM